MQHGTSAPTNEKYGDGDAGTRRTNLGTCSRIFTRTIAEAHAADEGMYLHDTNTSEKRGVAVRGI